MEHCIIVCNGLLRGERAAVETYNKALAHYAASPEAPELKRIRDEHVKSIIALEENVISMGGTPDLEEGLWGTFATTVQGAANALGEGAAIEALQTGERTGIRSYELALEDPGVMPGCKELIRTNLLPPITEHIAALERLQQQASAEA